jgi:hypothetical protein
MAAEILLGPQRSGGRKRLQRTARRQGLKTNAPSDSYAKNAYSTFSYRFALPARPKNFIPALTTKTEISFYICTLITHHLQFTIHNYKGVDWF